MTGDKIVKVSNLSNQKTRAVRNANNLAFIDAFAE